MESGCEECRTLKKKLHHERNTTILHTSALLICGQIKAVKKKQEGDKVRKEWKKSRDAFVRTLKKRISALRNSGGGIVFVHIQDIEPKDRCLDLFHELVDERLNDMIEDGSLFVTVYKKDWMSEEGDNTGFVAINVSPSISVVTLDYKTKIPLDNSIVKPSNTNILKFLTNDIRLKNKVATIRGLDYANLRESRHVQAKAFFINSETFADINKFVNYIWEDLRLREYVTSFSKIDGGGSLFIGIEEKEIHYEKYANRKLIKTGFKVDFSKTEIINKLKALVKSETVVLVKETDKVKFTQVDNIVDAVFHPLQEKKDYYILEIAVAAVAGLVFHDAEGPEAYEIDEQVSDGIKRIPPEDWYKRLFRQFKKRSIGVQTIGRN